MKAKCEVKSVRNQSVSRSRRVCWDGLDMLNVKMIPAGSSIVWYWDLKKLDREDARTRPGGIVLRMTYVGSLGLSQKYAQFRNKWRKTIKRANPGSPAKLTIKTECLHVSMCILTLFAGWHRALCFLMIFLSKLCTFLNYVLSTTHGIQIVIWCQYDHIRICTGITWKEWRTSYTRTGCLLQT